MQLARAPGRDALSLARRRTRERVETAAPVLPSASLVARPSSPRRVMTELLLDYVGRSGSPATMPGFHAGRPPRNKGQRYPADPPTVEEIVAVMRAAGDARTG